jgi:hypothetical protein
MRANFELYSAKTVPSTYSWDLGTPTVDYTNIKTISAGTGVKYVSGSSFGQATPSTNTTEITGYAPFVELVFISTLEPTNFRLPNMFLGIERVADFGDYYNSKNSRKKEGTINTTAFCHTYVMPGLYSIEFEQTEYVNTKINNARFIGTCLQKYCIEWSWSQLKCTPDSQITWKITKEKQNLTTGEGLSSKKWMFEPCTDQWAFGDRVYVEKTQKLDNKRDPLAWQWYNFLKTPIGNLNTPTVWASSGFQQPQEFTWEDASSPCWPYMNYQGEDVVWKWRYITKDVSVDPVHSINLTWNQAVKEKPTNVTWNYTSLYCPGDLINMELSAFKQTVTKTAYVRVLEIPPKAVIEVIQPEEPLLRLTPLTVKLSPKNVISGSFPIEKIVWDMGDGSPLITQRRWAPTLSLPFVYSGSTENDPHDPRNYDVEHTYYRTLQGPHSFYPSMTAYASSTGTYDTAAAVVGPLLFPPKTEDFKINLIQSEMTSYGKVYIGEINNNVAVWRADK